MSVEVANLLADASYTPSRIFEVNNEDKESSNGTNKLLERAEAVDAVLASWPDTLPSHWFPVRIFKDTIPQEVIDAGVYKGNSDIYPDIIICSTWNDWRVARLKVLRLIATLRPVNSLDIGEIGPQVIKDMQQLVDGICASIPFCFGSRTDLTPLYQTDVIYPGLEGRLDSKEHIKTAAAYGGWYLFSPLKMALDLKPYISNKQHQWLLLQLFRLARFSGVKPT